MVNLEKLNYKKIKSQLQCERSSEILYLQITLHLPILVTFYCKK